MDRAIGVVPPALAEHQSELYKYLGWTLWGKPWRPVVDVELQRQRAGDGRRRRENGLPAPDHSLASATASGHRTDQNRERPSQHGHESDAQQQPPTAFTSRFASARNHRFGPGGPSKKLFNYFWADGLLWNYHIVVGRTWGLTPLKEKNP